MNGQISGLAMRCTDRRPVPSCVRGSKHLSRRFPKHAAGEKEIWSLIQSQGGERHDLRIREDKHPDLNYLHIFLRPTAGTTRPASCLVCPWGDLAFGRYGSRHQRGTFDEARGRLQNAQGNFLSRQSRANHFFAAVRPWKHCTSESAPVEVRPHRRLERTKYLALPMHWERQRAQN